MDRFNFLQNDGFPFELDVLDGMQKAYEIFNCLGALAGNLTILSGCQITGGTVSNGYVHIDGEIYPFIGGAIGANVIIETTTQAAEFSDQSTHEIKQSKVARFGVGTTVFAWADFKRPETTTQLTTLLSNLTQRVAYLENVPTAFVVGMVMVWNRPANEIPVGWEEYTDLRGRMPVGMNPNYTQGTDKTHYNLEVLGYAGGSREHALTVAEMPAHNHSLTAALAGQQISTSGSGTQAAANVGINTANTGGNEAHTNMSPYRVVHFIKYVGLSN